MEHLTEEQMESLKNKHPNILEELSYMDISTHWYGVIDELCERINFVLSSIKSTEAVKADQVKSKFGGLRFYVHFDSDLGVKTSRFVNDLIELAELKSAGVCENCGNSLTINKTTIIKGWAATLCYDCVDAYGEK